MIRFFHVARGFAARDVLVDVNFTVDAGEAVLVSGAASGGKSLLARLLLGLDRPRRGWVAVDGLVLADCPEAMLAAHRRRVALVPQRKQFVEEADAAHNVALGLEVGGASALEARRLARACLERLGLGAIAERRAAQLSATERQWLGIARGLARSDAAIVVADDPTSGLDPADARRVGSLLGAERDRGKALLVLSQAESVPGLTADRVVRLLDGRAGIDPTVEGAATPADELGRRAS
jgi:ABC-type ATPase involved in cell division